MADIVPGCVGVRRRPSSWTHNVDAHLIKLATFGRWNHAAVVTAVDAGRVQITEAVAPGGVRRRWLRPGEDWLFETLPTISPAQLARIAAEATALLGAPYDMADVLRFVWRFWTNKAPRRKRPDYADDRVICSELVAWSLHVAGIDPWPRVAYGAVSPNDIADWILREASHAV